MFWLQEKNSKLETGYGRGFALPGMCPESQLLTGLLEKDSCLCSELRSMQSPSAKVGEIPLEFLQEITPPSPPRVSSLLGGKCQKVWSSEGRQNCINQMSIYSVLTCRENWDRPVRNPRPCHQFVYNLAQPRWTHIKCFVSSTRRFTRRPSWNGSLTNSCCGNCLLKVVGGQIEERFEGLGVPGKLQGSGSGCERCAGRRFQAKEKRVSKAFPVRA